MASLLPKDGILLDVQGQAPPPSKDFVQFLVKPNETIWRTWRITLRNDYKRLMPSELKAPLEDFEHDERLQFDIGRIFGENTLEYAKRLCKGQMDYLMRMPKPLLIYLTSFLELEDVAHLSQTCKLMYEICSAEALWEQIFHHHCDTVTEEMTSLALDMGWKQMFFTNKLQLQVKLRRHQQKRASPDGGTTFLTED